MKTLGLTGVLAICVAASAGAQQSDTDQAQSIPAAYRPPKGMCRIWLSNVPPALQPAPTDCAAAVKNVPTNGRVVFGDTEEVKNKPKADPKELPATKGYTGKPGEKSLPPLPPRKPPLPR